MKINKLYDSGNKIVLYTSRGMVSCDGDIEKAIEKNESILKEWLKENDVKYSELIFGKPIADFYIDDRCMNVKGFKESKLEEFNAGKSGKKVYRFGEYDLKFAVIPNKDSPNLPNVSIIYLANVEPPLSKAENISSTCSLDMLVILANADKFSLNLLLFSFDA